MIAITLIRLMRTTEISIIS
ncbi:unnamed protein product [Chironomus riparius]|uniref:Uncharacterized protein n=1 Tax=Chironomus riparius TaxID=315576 RepID=A0A9N9WP99_9DIPT|nr:unnamed protein product [Chironomus riparius]